ncbi:MAG TPA: pyrroloquinoline quinone biosynthesis peptide chaperone PqqD [Dongiaceae bacterium]|nr:pyrroloquinoline quinone biosynthesis peptide chaperone PqqD [Dongiaceae bacterium]
MTTAEPLLQLRAGYRLQFESAQQAWVLLFPEGMIQLNESAGMILKAFAEPRTVSAVIEDLQNAFPDADIRNDVLEFVAEAHEQRWLRTL